MTQLMQQNIKDDEKQNHPLRTEEIISILSKSNNKKFSKSEQISDKISINFKKHDINQYAKKIDEKKIQETNNIKIENSLEPTENNLKKQNSKEISQDKQSKIDSNLKEKNETEVIEKKKYTQEETDKIANELAKKYYQNGLRAGEHKIKTELANGKESIAMALKNTIDNIFLISPEYLQKLNNNINNVILSICNDIIGYQIEKLPEKFIEKINSLVESISETTNNAKIFLNEKDFSAIDEYFKKNKPKSNFSISVDNSLQRGDLIIKSGGIEVNNIFSKKIQVPKDNDISDEIKIIKDQNQGIYSSSEKKK